MRSFAVILSISTIGVEMSCGTLVGNMVGAGRADLAKQFYRTCFGVSWAFAALMILVMLVAQKPIISIYTNEEVIAGLIASVWPYLILNILIRSTVCVYTAVIRGTGI